MSATNRGAERNPQDYYVTPLRTVREFLHKFTDLEPMFKLKHALILDPCAGGDSTGTPMSYPNVLEEFGANMGAVITNDIREDSPAQEHLDFLDMPWSARFELIISNPPFSLAQDFVKGGLDTVINGGFVCYLLRLNFLGAQKRMKWWQENMPKYVIVHSNRPSFCKGSSDSNEYAHFCWQRGYKGPTQTFVI